MAQEKKYIPELRFPEFKNDGEWNSDTMENIFEIRKEDSMGTDKMYCMELEWNFNSKHIDVILDYIKKQMLDNEEIELWKIWQGRNRHHKKPVYCTYLINELNKVIFTQFFEGEEDYKCMKIIK